MGSRTSGRFGDCPLIPMDSFLSGEWWTDSTVFSDSACELLSTLRLLLTDMGGLPTGVTPAMIALVDMIDVLSASSAFWLILLLVDPVGWRISGSTVFFTGFGNY